MPPLARAWDTDLSTTSLSVPSREIIWDVIVLGLQHDYKTQDSAYDDFYRWHELCDFINVRFTRALTVPDVIAINGSLRHLHIEWNNREPDEVQNALIDFGIDRKKFRRDQDPEIVHRREHHLVLLVQQGSYHLPNSQIQINEMMDMQQRVYQRQQAQQAQ